MSIDSSNFVHLYVIRQQIGHTIIFHLSSFALQSSCIISHLGMATTTQLQPLVSLRPYKHNWKVKVFVTRKGSWRTYKNVKGQGCFFSVELTDTDGTQMQATMFNEAATKFFDKLETGKAYYISKGAIKESNKQYRTVANDYEMTLGQYSQVEEVVNESLVVPETKFNFVPLNQLEPYINQKDLVDVVGVVTYVSPKSSIRRKQDEQIIPKRDIRIVDETKTSVVVCLWQDHAINVGQDLLDMVDKSPVVAIKSLKVGYFRGMSLSTLSHSYIRVNADIPECVKLKSWYDSEGTALSSSTLSLNRSIKSESPSLYHDRVTLTHITTNPSLGDEKPEYFNIRACMVYINPHKNMVYQACNTCNKKVTDSVGSGYWCERCRDNKDTCNLRYVLSAKFSDESGEAWFTLFNEQAKTLLGCSADDLVEMKAQEEGNNFHIQLKKSKWIPFVFRVVVASEMFNNVKRQKISVVAISPVEFAAATRSLLDDISSMNNQCRSTSDSNRDQINEHIDARSICPTGQGATSPLLPDDRQLQQTCTPSQRDGVRTPKAICRSPMEEEVGRRGNDRSDYI